MDPGLKQRLIGAAVLIALAVIFLPMLVQGPAPDSGVSDLSLQVPDAPGGDYVTRDLPLVVPEATGSGGLLADDGRLATVDTATAPAEGTARPEDAADLADDLGAVPVPDAAPGDVLPGSASEAVPLDRASPPVAAAPLPDADRADASAPTPQPAGTDAAAVVRRDATPAAQEPVAPPTPVATPSPAATAAGDYAVNFGAYGTRGDAGTVVQRLRAENLPAYVEETRVGGRDAWRVRIGPYANRAAAEAARTRAGSIGSRAQATVVALDGPASPGRDGATASPAAASPRTTSAPQAATPSPAPAAGAADTGFAVQVGAFANAADANALRDRLRGAGITAFTDTVTTDKGRLTRVKAGPVATRAEAEQLKARVKAGTGVDGLVRAHP